MRLRLAHLHGTRFVDAIKGKHVLGEVDTDGDNLWASPFGRVDEIRNPIVGTCCRSPPCEDVFQCSTATIFIPSLAARRDRARNTRSR